MVKTTAPTSQAAASVAFTVRDYECDLSGIVNNASYLNYLEHARHEFLSGKGINFSELCARGIHLVVAKLELEYRRPLRPQDVFEVRTTAERLSPVRFVFHQHVFRGGELMLSAKVVGTALDERGRPRVFPELSVLS